MQGKLYQHPQFSKGATIKISKLNVAALNFLCYMANIFSFGIIFLVSISLSRSPFLMQEHLCGPLIIQ